LGVWRRFFFKRQAWWAKFRVFSFKHNVRNTDQNFRLSSDVDFSALALRSARSVWRAEALFTAVVSFDLWMDLGKLERKSIVRSCLIPASNAQLWDLGG
jgi:hypothetical protein